MSEAEKQDLINVLRQTRSILEPVAAKQIEGIKHAYDEMMKSIEQITYSDLRADLINQAAKLLSYTSEHQAPIEALDAALTYAEQTKAADLTKEKVKEISEESGWLKLKNI